MTTNIQSSGVEISPKTMLLTRKRMHEALEKLNQQVERASLHIIDTNGPLLGGKDKACRVVVEISNGDAIIIEDRDYQVDELLSRITSQLDAEVKKRNQQDGLLSKIVRKAFSYVPNAK
jgi:hypothetical protein